MKLFVDFDKACIGLRKRCGLNGICRCGGGSDFSRFSVRCAGVRDKRVGRFGGVVSISAGGKGEDER